MRKKNEMETNSQVRKSIAVFCLNESPSFLMALSVEFESSSLGTAAAPLSEES